MLKVRLELQYILDLNLMTVLFKSCSFTSVKDVFGDIGLFGCLFAKLLKMLWVVFVNLSGILNNETGKLSF